MRPRAPILLIVGTSKDTHIDMVMAHLPPDLGVLRLNIDHLPARSRIKIEFNREGRPIVAVAMNPIDELTDLETVAAVWFRRIGAPQLDPLLRNTAHRLFALGETEATVAGLAHLLNDAYWVSPYEATIRARSKTFQLALAGRSGLSIPRTIITNDPNEAESFINTHQRVLYKTLHSPTVAYDDHRSLIFSHLLTPGDMRLLEQVRYAPCQFQEYIEKDHELRLTFTGQEFFAIRIDSQAVPAARVDWRAAPPADLRYTIVTLPSEVERHLISLMSALALRYGAIDMIVTPGGDFVFLEVNPHGAWGWLETATGAPISKSIADYLVRVAKRPSGA